MTAASDGKRYLDEAGVLRLIEALELVIKGKDARLIRDLKAREPMAFIAIGNKLVEAGVGEEIAEQCFQLAIDLGITGAYVNLGLLLTKLPARRDDAEQAFLAAIEAGAKDAHNSLANHYLRAGREEDALRHYRSAVEEGDANAMLNLGDELLRQGGHDEAEMLFRRAIELGNKGALRNLALLLAGQPGREGEAGKYFLLAVEAGDESVAEPFAAFQEQLRARGYDFHRLTQESIKGARASSSLGAPPRTEALRQALRRVGQEKSRDAMRSALLQLGPAVMAYHRRNAHGDAYVEPSRRFSDAEQLLQFLASEESADGTWVYRGQNRRVPRYRLLDKAGNVFTYESMFPHDFRFVTAHPDPQSMGKFEAELDTTRARAKRDCYRFIVHVVRHCLSQEEQAPHLQWLREHYPEELRALAVVSKADVAGEPDYGIFGSGFGGYRLWRLFWSLAQHYALSTALLDVTYSPQVALWFATHAWNEAAAPPSEGTGVVYRFDTKALEGLLILFEGMQALHEKRLGSLNRLGPFLQDLRSIPPAFAARPSGQQGASLYGLDYLYLLEAVDASGVVEAFEFEHASSPPRLGVDRTSVVPKEDPFLSVSAGFQPERAR